MVYTCVGFWWLQLVAAMAVELVMVRLMLPMDCHSGPGAQSMYVYHLCLKL
jgi:hypothetical protein